MTNLPCDTLTPVPAVNSRGAQLCASMGVPQGSFLYLRRRFIIILNAIWREHGHILVGGDRQTLDRFPSKRGAA